MATFLESMASDDAEAAEYLADYSRPAGRRWPASPSWRSAVASGRRQRAAPLWGLGRGRAAGGPDGAARPRRRAAQLLAFLALVPATIAAISVTMDLAGTAPLVLPAWANL